MKKIHFTDRYLLNPRHPVTVFVIGAGGTGSQVINQSGTYEHGTFKHWAIRDCMSPYSIPTQ